MEQIRGIEVERGSGNRTSDANGLTVIQVRERLIKFGPNTIEQAKRISPWKVLIGQFTGSMFWLLFAASIIAGAVGEWVDSAAIMAIVIVNGLIGFAQEYKAEKAVEALRAMTAPRARVRRDGTPQTIPAAEVVPGDILLLEAGDIIAADAVLLEANSLLVNEAPLTGESMPIEKHLITGVENDCKIFLGTTVSNGTGVAEVESTGMQTQFGGIAHLIQTATEEETPLKKRLAVVSRNLIFLCCGIVVVVAAIGFYRGNPWISILLSSVSLAVAAVPEGMLAIVTIALAVGVQRMAKKNALVRKLPAVETLGCATVVCTDKTGTLTQGKMELREVFGENVKQVLYSAVACSDAELPGKSDHNGTPVGDPTEVAMLEYARKEGIEKAEIEKENPRKTTSPFDSERKMMSILRSDGILYVKGAPEAILKSAVNIPGGIADAATGMAKRGLRVLAIATGDKLDESHLSILGLVGIADPPREEAISAVAIARKAGIRVVMVTGDHPITARAISEEMGILKDGDNPDELIHSRTTPSQKLDIVRSWKDRGHIVAMTGDGVNDAPALKESHIGISMGRGGTEVAREASDIVLADDNFATIVSAVKEGRNIFENIRKTLVYLLGGNIAELFIMLGAATLGMPAPLLPLHLLWINLVTDSFPALALTADPATDALMQIPPRSPLEKILGKKEWLSIGIVAAIQGIMSLLIYDYYLSRDPEVARSEAFSFIVFSEVIRAFAFRSQDRLFWEEGIFSNLILLFVVTGAVLVQVSIHHIEFTQRLFQIHPMSFFECIDNIILALIPVSLLEIIKLVRRHFNSFKRAGSVTAALLLSLFLSGISCKKSEDASHAGHSGHSGHASQTENAETHENHGENSTHAVELAPGRVQEIGIRSEPIIVRNFVRKIRAVGAIKADETRLAHVHLKFSGYIEQLNVDFVGRAVSRGEVLFTIYSPDLYVTQNEFLTAIAESGKSGEDTGELSTKKELIASIERRLELWDISPLELATIKRTGKAIRALPVRSPISGIVLEKMALRGMNVEPEMELYLIADLSHIWLQAELYETEITDVHIGQNARLVLEDGSSPVAGRVTFVSPTLSEKTRTAGVRFEFPNPGMRLKPGMFGTAEIETSSGRSLAIPVDAVIDTGERKIIFLDNGDGHFEGREVQLGPKSGEYFPVLSGIENTGTLRVVTSGQFLLDSESRLQSTKTGPSHGSH